MPCVEGLLSLKTYGIFFFFFQRFGKCNPGSRDWRVLLTDLHKAQTRVASQTLSVTLIFIYSDLQVFNLPNLTVDLLEKLLRRVRWAIGSDQECWKVPEAIDLGYEIPIALFSFCCE